MLLRVILLCLLIQLISFSPLSHATEEFWEYTFRPGDTIWNIAKQHTNSVNNWSEIQRINNIGKGPDRTILPGTRIKIPISMLKQKPIPAIVIALSGGAKVIRANGDSEPVETGSELFSGDRVITTENQSLRLQFADKSELQVLANSEVILDKLSYHKKTGMVDTRVRLQRGRVNTWVEKLKPKSRYQIQTPAAVTAVRGTSYRLVSDANNISRTEVTEGLVGVSAEGKSQQVQSGFGLVVEKGKPPPEPVKLLSAPDLSDNQSAAYGQLNLSWSQLDGAVQYRVQLATDEDFDQVLFNRSTNESVLVVDELAAGRYFLRVRGIDSYQLEGLNAVRSYRIAQAPENHGNAEKIIIPSGMLILGQ